MEKTIVDQASELIDLSQPHKGFGYPAFPDLPFAGRELFERFRTLVYPQRKESVQIYQNHSHAFSDFLKGYGKLIRIATHKPLPRELLVAESMLLKEGHEIQWHFLSRDLEELQEKDFERVDLYFLSQPNRCDGFYYPHDLLIRLLQKALKNPEIDILVDESAALFSFNEVAPGNLKRLLGHPKFYFLDSINPLRDPVGSKTSWIYGAKCKERRLERVFEEVGESSLKESFLALNSFSNKQGRAVAEFARRILVLERSLRLVADSLRPALEQRWIRVPHWPQCGIYLLIDTTSLLQKENLSLPEWLQRIENNLNLRLENAEYCGHANHVRLCYAAHLGQWKKIQPKIERAFLPQQEFQQS